MIRIFISLILYLITMLTHAQTASDSLAEQGAGPVFDIEVTVSQIKTNTGTVLFALYSSAEAFKNRQPVQFKSLKVEAGGVAVTFENVPQGMYAISCIYDENGNGKMDFSTNGIPEEDYGFSNNIMSFGPPSFDEVKFEVTDKDLTFEIIL